MDGSSNEEIDSGIHLSAASINPEIKKGWLCKESRGKGASSIFGKNSKKRYCVLDSGVFRYFEGKQEEPPFGVDLKGEVNLTDGDILDVDRGKLKMCITHKSDNSELMLVAEDEKEYSFWYSAIQHHIAYANYVLVQKQRFGGFAPTEKTVRKSLFSSITGVGSSLVTMGKGVHVPDNFFNSYDIKKADIAKYEEMFYNFKVFVYGASGLSAADLVLGMDNGLGKSDPYAKVFLNGKEMGRTEHISGSLNPKWTQNKFEIYYPESESPSDQKLEFHVFDWNLINEHEFLGGFEITSTSLAAWMKQARTSPDELFLKAFSLGTVSSLNPDEQSLATKGSLSVGLCYSEASGYRRRAPPFGFGLWITPTPILVLKMKDSKQNKVIFNVCTHDRVAFSFCDNFRTIEESKDENDSKVIICDVLVGGSDLETLKDEDNRAPLLNSFVEMVCSKFNISGNGEGYVILRKKGNYYGDICDVYFIVGNDLNNDGILNDDDLLLTSAATKIQSIHRGRQARKTTAAVPAHRNSSVNDVDVSVNSNVDSRGNRDERSSSDRSSSNRNSNSNTNTNTNTNSNINSNTNTYTNSNINSNSNSNSNNNNNNHNNRKSNANSITNSNSNGNINSNSNNNNGYSVGSSQKAPFLSKAPFSSLECNNQEEEVEEGESEIGAVEDYEPVEPLEQMRRDTIHAYKPYDDSRHFIMPFIVSQSEGCLSRSQPNKNSPGRLVSKGTQLFIVQRVKIPEFSEIWLKTSLGGCIFERSVGQIFKVAKRRSSVTGGMVVKSTRSIYPGALGLPLQVLVDGINVIPKTVDGVPDDKNPESFCYNISFKVCYAENSFVPITRLLSQVLQLRKELVDIGCKNLMSACEFDGDEHLHFMQTQVDKDGDLKFMEDVNLMIYLQDALKSYINTALDYLNSNKATFSEKGSSGLVELFFKCTEDDMKQIDLYF